MATPPLLPLRRRWQLHLTLTGAAHGILPGLCISEGTTLVLEAGEEGVPVRLRQPSGGFIPPSTPPHRLKDTLDKGDNASFNWSLDGVPLNTSLAYFSDKEHIVILKKNVTGDLVCIAKNQINEEKSDSVKSNCSVTAEDIRVSVYGALGDSVHLHFNTTLNSSVHVEWKQGDKPIGVIKNNRPGFKDPYINRAEIFANGTLRLDRTQKNDSGDYSVDVFNTDGTNIFKGSMQVYIQEAVSQPVVHSTCLSHGKVLLVCTVDKGDNASFNWSLDGVPLNTSLAYFSDEEHVVILKKHVSEKEYVDMRETRAMVALDISNTSEKEYIDMRETRAMAALDISDPSEKSISI
ncbi:UNVERIFIED_CONTAM: hypothetical protein FKN15_039428 [Acipenser sinensis]